MKTFKCIKPFTCNRKAIQLNDVALCDAFTDLESTQTVFYIENVGQFNCDKDVFDKHFTADEHQISAAWLCTDPDSYQFRLQKDHYVWSFIEVREFDNALVICAATIDLSCYSKEAIWNYCSGYYDSFAEMIDCYEDYAPSIMAECIFEGMDIIEMDIANPVGKTDTTAMLYELLHCMSVATPIRF